MARRVEDVDPDAADADGRALAQQDRSRRPGIGVPPVGAALIGEMERGPRERRQFAGPGDEIGVDVGFGDARDPEAGLLRRGHVLFDSTVGIDDQGLAASRRTR